MKNEKCPPHATPISFFPSLSISAMRPLHPLLSGHYSENITFDRSDKPEIHKVIVRDPSGNPMTNEQIEQFLTGTDRSIYRKWIPDNPRATGLFIYDIAIDSELITAEIPNPEESERFKVGDTVGVSFKEHSLHILPAEK